MTWQVNILTLFPELFPGPLTASVTGRALKQGLWSLTAHNIRDFALDKHKSLDDKTAGGGKGMVMRPDVLFRAIRASFDLSRPSFYLSPRGKVFNQDKARELSKLEGINLLCGRFEGLDQRVIDHFQLEEISLGDFILTSGDLASYCILDAIIRNIPGVLDSSEALEEESFGNSDRYKYLLEYPHYTKPALYEGREIPAILLSGNHQKIAQWRLEEAEKKTQTVRPDLWKKYKKFYQK
jgi:tRNA (guanine37-N1)-methyltransferase